MMIRVATIGFTAKSAERFFMLLRNASVKTLLDVRLNNSSQLAGFAKKDDLRFFVSELVGAQYQELGELAPEASMLKRYREKELDWTTYASAYCELLARRRVESNLDEALFDRACLLCSEHLPHHCHRRLAVEYLNEAWGQRMEVVHLV
ncbi:DUF488 family protein [Pararobbsia alpina]|uniref:DUF488 domain-containing protein n=1 Tax=Pararobbsia alpina TaxID=621374 RepID=A0A6S7AVS1_9BURK|nr:DUF488 domain-containing protein [Pararobbsia alpina]CAB3779106.1 hypothetical protein LMG28138_00792 [Pararobbsia alpina]